MSAGPSQSNIPPPPPPPPPSSSSSPLSIDQSHFTNSQNLYLVTFLATLFLLLSVSCAIILRSYILRRRYQRRLEEALGSGLLLAPRAQGSKRKRIGAKPKMINTWLAEGGARWNQMMPLSAQPIFVKRRIRENPVVTPNATPSTPSTAVTAGDSNTPTSSSSLVTNLIARFRRSPSHDIEDTGPNASRTKMASSGSIPNYRIRVEMLQLSVLISMPSPNSKNRILENTDSGNREEEEADDKDSEQLPNLVFGVTRVSYRQPKSTSGPVLPLPKSTTRQGDAETEVS